MKAGAALCLLSVAAQAEEAPIRVLGCLPLEALQQDHRPPELARAVRACIGEARYAEAMQVYYAYSSYTLFDQQRVRDESAHIVLQDLTPWIFLGYSRDIISELRVQADRLRDPDAAFLAETCAAIRAAGRPAYRPSYMIRHGMMPRKHDEDWGHDDFDPAAAWEKALSEVNQCPKPE